MSSLAWFLSFLCLISSPLRAPCKFHSSRVLTQWSKMLICNSGMYSLLLSMIFCRIYSSKYIPLSLYVGTYIPSQMQDNAATTQRRKGKDVRRTPYLCRVYIAKVPVTVWIFQKTRVERKERRRKAEKKGKKREVYLASYHAMLSSSCLGGCTPEKENRKKKNDYSTVRRTMFELREREM